MCTWGGILPEKPVICFVGCNGDGASVSFDYGLDTSDMAGDEYSVFPCKWARSGDMLF